MWDLVRFERWEHATHTTPQARRRLVHLLSCDDTIPLLGGAVPAQNAPGKIRGSPSEGVRNVSLKKVLRRIILVSHQKSSRAHLQIDTRSTRKQHLEGFYSGAEDKKA